MNREIKFRAWDEQEKQMYAPIITENGKSAELWYGYEIQGDTNDKLMQYTGLKDKNDREIYEGDIVKEFRISRTFPNGKERIRAIEWREDMILDDSYGESAVGFNLFGGELEIIGNIYENPELLK